MIVIVTTHVLLAFLFFVSKPEHIDLIQRQASCTKEFNIDWTKCVLCQENTGVALVSPAGYESFVEDIQRYDRSGLCPYKLHS